MAMYQDSATKNPRPNVIWIMADQFRVQSTGYMGDPNARTPNMDRLAATGASFTGAYAGYPLCCPCRGSMLTSRYPHECSPGHEYPLPKGMPTIADCFREHGYDTFWLGKWHLGGQKEAQAPTKDWIVPRELRGGFQHWLGYENNNSQYDCWLHGHNEQHEIPPFPVKGYETDALTDRFLAYLDERAGQRRPFFAVLSVQPPHEPHVAPAEFSARYNPSTLTLRPNVPPCPSLVRRVRRDLAGYYAQIENFDHNIGRVLNCLIQNGLFSRTHVVVFSDHGDCHGSNGRLRKNVPFEEAVRVPFLVSGEIPAPYNFDGRLSGDICDVLLNHVDVAPTTLGLCGIDKPGWMEGTDYSGYRLEWRKKQKTPLNSLYLQSCIPTLHGNGADRPWRGVVTLEGWKYVCFEEMPWLLFNLKDDPYETVNLALEPPYFSKRAELHHLLEEWIKTTRDRFALPSIRVSRLLEEK